MTDQDRDEARKESLNILIEHIVHRWDAEEENARRLGVRSGQLFALITALLVLGLFKVSGSSLAVNTAPPPLISILGTVAAVLLIWSLQKLLRVRLKPPQWWTRFRSAPPPNLSRSETVGERLWLKDQETADDDEFVDLDSPTSPRAPLASARLAWPQEITPGTGAWDELDPAEALHVRYLALQEAVDRLHESNTGAATANGLAQERLFGAAFFLGFILLCYLWSAGTGAGKTGEGPISPSTEQP